MHAFSLFDYCGCRVCFYQLIKCIGCIPCIHRVIYKKIVSLKVNNEKSNKVIEVNWDKMENGENGEKKREYNGDCVFVVDLDKDDISDFGKVKTMLN